MLRTILLAVAITLAGDRLAWAQLSWEFNDPPNLPPGWTVVNSGAWQAIEWSVVDYNGAYALAPVGPWPPYSDSEHYYTSDVYSPPFHFSDANSAELLYESTSQLIDRNNDGFRIDLISIVNGVEQESLIFSQPDSEDFISNSGSPTIEPLNFVDLSEIYQVRFRIWDFDLAKAPPMVRVSQLGVFSGDSVLLGDANFDGKASGADYTVWADNFKLHSGVARYVQGDFNRDGEIDGGDYTLWADNFASAASAAIPIPEPATIWLALLATGGVLMARRIVPPI